MAVFTSFPKHHANRVPNRNRPLSLPSTTVSGHIIRPDSVTAVSRILIDSAASVNTINEDVVREAGLPTLECDPISLRLADGRPWTLVKMCTFRLSIKGLDNIIQAYVTKSGCGGFITLGVVGFMQFRMELKTVAVGKKKNLKIFNAPDVTGQRLYKHTVQESDPAANDRGKSLQLYLNVSLAQHMGFPGANHLNLTGPAIGGR